MTDQQFKKLMEKLDEIKSEASPGCLLWLMIIVLLIKVMS